VNGENVVKIILLLIVAPVIVAALGLYYAAQYFWAYASGMKAGLGIGSAATALPVQRPPTKQDGDRQPAYRHYLFGQAWLDARHVFRLTYRRQWQLSVKTWEKLVRTAFARANRLESRMIMGALRVLSLAYGFMLAASALLFIALAQAGTLAVLFAVCLGFVYLLRGLDTAFLRVRRIGITCPNPGCYKRVPYPAYECPKCRTLHSDVRPGRYGVLRRRCQCGEPLKTLILFGSHAMKAVCPACKNELEENAGSAMEIVLPIFGAGGAGKTQLMAALIIATEAAAEQADGEVEPADSHTRDWLAVARRQFLDERKTPKTGTKLQRPYTFKLKPRRRRGRMFKIFDAAGETFYDSDKIDSLRYAAAARTFVYVLDPLSIEKLWRSLGPATRSSVESLKLRADRDPASVFENTIQNFANMGVEIEKAHLVVAVSKSDLVENQLDAAGIDDDASIRAWLAESLEQENMIRAMDHAFKNVRFLLTSALPDGRGVDSSIDELASSILTSEGFRW
jgi:hypothetical protein